MIRLRSTATAEALAVLRDCRQRIAEAERLGQTIPKSIASGYRRKPVKDSILAETARKCAYCESKMEGVYWGDVEHIKPKCIFPQFGFDYDNITLACARCNNRKRNYYDEANPILNPYEDAPDDHLVGAGTLVWQRNGSEAGRRTIELLDLNRQGLVEKRLECIQRADALAIRYITESNEAIKCVLAEKIVELTADSAEFALVVRSFLELTYNIHLGELLPHPN